MIAVVDIKPKQAFLPLHVMAPMSSSQAFQARKAITIETLRPPSITRVCKEMREEALATFHSLNTFEVDYCCRDRLQAPTLLISWLIYAGAKTRKTFRNLFIVDTANFEHNDWRHCFSIVESMLTKADIGVRLELVRNKGGLHKLSFDKDI